MRALAAREAPQLSLRVDSAGTSNYHPGAPPDRRSQAAALRRGYDMSDLRARQVRRSDFQEFDLILAMDHGNLEDLLQAAPPGSHARIRLFLQYAQDPRRLDVPDPYYGGPGGFDEVLDLVEAASRGLLKHLLSGSGPGA